MVNIFTGLLKQIFEICTQFMFFKQDFHLKNNNVCSQHVKVSIIKINMNHETMKRSIIYTGT